MRSPRIIIRRFPYEEPYHAHLEFELDNGLFRAKTDIYCNVGDIAAIGKGLLEFPSRVGDEYCYRYGSEDPKDNFYRFFPLRAYTIDLVGHCALQFAMNTNTQEPDEGSFRFSIRADPAALNRLGELFLHFGQLKHLEFVWSPTEGELYEDHHTSDA